MNLISGRSVASLLRLTGDFKSYSHFPRSILCLPSMSYNVLSHLIRQDVILKMAKRSKGKMNLLRDSNSNASTMLLSLHDAHSQKMDHTDVVSKM